MPGMKPGMTGEKTGIRAFSVVQRGRFFPRRLLISLGFPSRIEIPDRLICEFCVKYQCFA
jgi:hypothetical protein